MGPIQVVVQDGNNLVLEVTPTADTNVILDRGVAGTAATIAVGTTTSLAPGNPATVTNVGTSAAAVFNFGIPTAGGIAAGGSTTQVQYNLSGVLAGSANMTFNGTTFKVGTNTILSNVNVLSASYDSVSFSVAVQETSSTDLFFSPDGLKMYILGSTGDDVNEYNLSTAWVVSSAVFVTTFSVAAQDSSPTGLFFRADGKKMYVLGATNDAVFQYTLSTPWSVATASYDSVSFSVATQDISPNAISFKPNGLSMYMVGATGDLVYQYTLSTAWNVSTATFLQSFSVAGQETISNAVTFTGDGSRMFVMGQTGDDVNVYNLTTPWDISTSAFVGLFSVAAQDTVPQGLYIKPDGTKMYMVGSSTDAVYQYTVPSIDIQLTGPTSAAALDVQQDLTVYGATTAASGSFTSLSDSGNLAFTGTGNRIRGDFSNATIANRVAFQSSTTNGNTQITVFPNGTATNSGLDLYSNSDPTNTSRGLIRIDTAGVDFKIDSNRTGTGTYLPMTFYTGGSERVRIDTSGNMLVGPITLLANSTFVANAGVTARTAAASAITPYLQLYNGNSGTDLKTWRLGGQGDGSLSFESVNDAYTVGSVKMTITNAGNVGIGTSSPTSVAGYGALTLNGTTGSFLALRTNGTDTAYVQTNASSFDLKGVNNVPMILYTNNTERARIENAGDILVGVGTTASAHLTVYGAGTTSSSYTNGDATGATLYLRDSGTSSGNGGQILFGSAFGVHAGIKGLVTNGTGPAGDLVFQTRTTTGNVTEKLRITSVGDVGIGTSSPQSKFVVSNGGAAGLEFFVNYPGGGVGTYIQSYNRSGTAYVNTAYDALSHSFRTSSTERVIIASTGIVTMNAYGAGTATFSAAGVISSVSDETWKIKDGVPVNPDAMLKKLEPGYWYYNDEKKESFGADRQLGFYAQNVNAAIGPEAAPEPEEGNPWGYYDRSVLAVVVMSLQKALATIESLEARIATLESKP